MDFRIVNPDVESVHWRISDGRSFLVPLNQLKTPLETLVNGVLLIGLRDVPEERNQSDPEVHITSAMSCVNARRLNLGALILSEETLDFLSRHCPIDQVELPYYLLDDLPFGVVYAAPEPNFFASIFYSDRHGYGCVIVLDNVSAIRLSGTISEHGICSLSSST